MTSPLLHSVQEREAYPPAEVISGAEFLTDVWDYTPGQHVTILAPTQWGKTTLCYQLLNKSSSMEIPGFVLVVKPRDPVPVAWSEQLGYKTIHTWPPPALRKYRGYNVWPKHTFDSDVDDPKHAALFKRVLIDCYKRGNRIVFCDESTGLTDDLKLSRNVVTIHKRGASMGCGMWITDQRPFYVVQTAYSQAEHLFIGKSTDARDRKRYGEIGGIDPYLVDRETMRLEKYQWLYIRRTGPQMCVVDNREGTRV